MILSDDVSFELLRNYGFQQDTGNYCFSFENDECTVFIISSKRMKEYKYRHLYIEFKEHSMILTEKTLSAIYKMIADGILKGEEV